MRPQQNTWREIPALCSPSQSSRADVMWSMRLVASSFKEAICFCNSTTNKWDQQWQQFSLGLGSFDNNNGDSNWEIKKVLYFSLPSLHDCNVNHSLTVGFTKKVNTPRRTLVRSPTIHFPYIWCFKGIEMIAIEFEKTRGLFLIATFSLPSPSSLLKLTILYNVALTAWRDTFTFLVSINCKL